MDATTNILLGVLGNICFAILVFTLNKLKLINLRKWTLKVLNIGIDQYYKNREESNKYLFDDNKNTKSIKILTNRGYFFADSYDIGDPSLRDWNPLPHSKVLLINPESEYTLKRYKEIKTVAKNQNWNIEHFKSDIKNSAAKMTGIENLELRFHSEPSVFRLIITDDYLYLSGFPGNDFGKNKPVYRIPKNTFLFSLINKYFDEIWERSKVYSEVYGD